MTTSPAASEAARYAELAEKQLEGVFPSNGEARAITYALLHIGAVIADAAERHTADADTGFAMLDDWLDAISNAVDPSFILPSPRPLWARLAGLFRRAPGWHETADGGDQ
jgi:hypothetical protein